jgi:acyl-CoA oxidase
MYMGALSLGRAFITSNSLGFTCNALNIGLKYSCVRRQFEGPSKEEQLIIDYPVVRHKLMPMIANAYIFFIVGSEIVKLYDHNTKEVLRPKSKLAA